MLVSHAMVRHQGNGNRVSQGHGKERGYAVAVMVQRRWWKSTDHVVASSPKHWLCLCRAGGVNPEFVECQSLCGGEEMTSCASYEGLCKQDTKIVQKPTEYGAVICKGVYL